VKFQLVYANELTTEAHHHYGLFANLELGDDVWRQIAAECADEGVGLACDVFGLRSLRLAVACGAAAVKIHASDVFHDALIAEALDTAPHVYLSIGGVRPDEVRALVTRWGADRARLTLLYGFQAEPTRTEDNHLARLGRLRAEYPSAGFGFMDHTDGDSDESGWLSALALPFGVSVIEKHITLDRRLEIEDYVSALAPEGFAAWVARLRLAETAIGGMDLTLSGAEEQYRRKALKAVVATTALAPGALIAASDVTLLRTPMADGVIPLVRLDDALGRRMARGVAAGTALQSGDLS
jgi:N,N'-diacetyllegionaminate synthase